MKLIIKVDKIYTPNLVDGKYLVIDGQQIKEITDDIKKYNLQEYKLIDYSKYQLIPGLIDIHIHGAVGVEVMDRSLESIKRLSEYAFSKGITSLLPTTLTSSRIRLKETLNILEEAIKDNNCENIIGVHLEGPFINSNQSGAQNENFIQIPDEDYVKEIVDDYSKLIKIVSLAPEIEGGLSAIEYLHQEDIVVSVAHSDADFNIMQQSFERGLSQATHFFNKMKGLHHREPGIVGAVLHNSDCTCELIVDGIHIHPKVVDLVINIKGIDKVILISDSMQAAGMPADEYTLGDYQVIVDENGKACLPDGTLAGSTLNLIDGIKNVMEFTDLKLAQALEMATVNPAKKLGLSKKGRLQSGYDADFVVVNSDLEVIATYINGKQVYKVLSIKH